MTGRIVRRVDFRGGEFDGLGVDCDASVDVFIELVRGAMYTHIKKDLPEIQVARELAESLGRK